MNPLTTGRLETLRRSYDIIPVVREISGAGLTPVAAYRALSEVSPEAFLFESVEQGVAGRYSMVGFHARRTLSFGRGEADCSQRLRDELRPLRVFGRETLPPFLGGAVGFFGYDVARWSERLPDSHPNELNLPDAKLLFFDNVVVFDHLEGRTALIVNLFANDRRPSGELLADAEARLDRAEAALRVVRGEPEMVPPEEPLEDPGFEPNLSREQFLEMVREAKEEIAAGEIYQIVLSQRWSVDFPAERSLDLYRALRAINPSPYMFLLRTAECSLVGTSPEMLVRVSGRTCETRPIAGTRRRGETPEEDAQLEAELRGDPKENAEHLMLVDLGRNDIGRVSQRGSVEVTEYAGVERYSHVMHLVSNVRGTLRPDATSIDAFLAAFPAGTVSGAPKIRAMELIDRMEPSRRGPYAGAVGYFDFSGNLDSCITIRTILLAGGKAYVQAGAGIVYDSDPQKEYEETISKAAALKRAVAAVRQASIELNAPLIRGRHVDTSS